MKLSDRNILHRWTQTPNLKSTMLSMRRQVIPPDPKFMTDINIDLPIFLYKEGENVVKADQVLADGWRIMLFTTNED